MSESDKPEPWRVRKADGTEIRVPTRALLESWILAGVVEPEDKVARPGEEDYIRVRELKDVSEAVETGSVVHGPRTVPTHPPVFAVVDGPKTVPPPVPSVDPEVIELEPLEGDTIQDAPIIEERQPTADLEVARTRVAKVDDDQSAPDYPTESPADDRQPPAGATLDEMLPSLEAGPVPTEPAPRTGRVAVAPTTLAPLIVGGNYVSDQAIDPSEKPGSLVPHIDADGEIIEERREAPRTGRVAVRATDIDAAHREIELQSTHPERTGIPDSSDHPTQPTVPRVTERPDILLQSSETSSKPSALHQTLNKTPIAPAATEALSRPLQRAGALGGSYSEELEVRALQRERRRTVLITLSLILLLGGGVAFWWISQDTPDVADEAAVASEVRAEESKAEQPEENAVEPTPQEAPVAEEEARAEAAPEEGDAPTAQAHDDTAKPSEATAIEQQEAEEQRQAAEAAREVAAAAVDEELESEANLPEEKPAAAKKTKKKTKKPGNAASPSKGYASLMRAAKKLKRKQPSKALELYKQALAQRPSSVDALSNVGRLQLKSGKTSAAIKTFKRCRKAMPRYTPCMYWHGRSLEKAGRRSDAEKAYEKYLDVNPDGSQAIDVRRRLSR